MDELQGYAVGSYKGDGDGLGKSVDDVVREVERNIDSIARKTLYL
jgi:hypothetical protein